MTGVVILIIVCVGVWALCSDSAAYKWRLAFHEDCHHGVDHGTVCVSCVEEGRLPPE